MFALTVTELCAGDAAVPARVGWNRFEPHSITSAITTLASVGKAPHGLRICYKEPGAAHTRPPSLVPRPPSLIAELLGKPHDLLERPLDVPRGSRIRQPDVAIV